MYASACKLQTRAARAASNARKLVNTETARVSFTTALARHPASPFTFHLRVTSIDVQKKLFLDD
jgi:hypothetical protein